MPIPRRDQWCVDATSTTCSAGGARRRTRTALALGGVDGVRDPSSLAVR
jgi:hypothetical protein